MEEKDLLKELEGLKNTTEDFKKFLKEQSEKNKKYAMISNILTIAVVIVILLYLFALWSTVKNNFQSDKVATSLQKHAPDLVEPVSESVVKIMTNIYPVYSRETTKRLVKIMPKLSMQADEEMTKFTEETRKQIAEQIRTALTKSIEHEQGPLRKAFPNLKDSEAKQLTSEMSQALEQDLLDISHHIANNTFDQLIDLKKVVDSFDVKGLPDNEQELSRLFIHYFLLLLDAEVMEGGAPHGR